LGFKGLDLGLGLGLGLGLSLALSLTLQARKALDRVANGEDVGFGELRKIGDLLGYKIMPDHFEGFNDRKNQAILNLREALAKG
jgi:hypothetical protein